MVGDHRHQHREDRDLRDQALELEHHQGADGARHQVHDQPGNAALQLRAGRGEHHLFTARTHHQLRVLGPLGPDRLEHVVDRDHAEQPPLRIDHRQHEIPVLLELHRNRVPVDIGRDRRDLAIADVGDPFGGPRDDQTPQAHDADESVLAVDHEDVVRLLFRLRLADRPNRLGDRHLLADLQDVGRHQSTGRRLVVGEQVPEHRSARIGHPRKNRLADRIRGQLQQVRRVVGRHRLDQRRGISRIVPDEILEHAHRKRTHHVGERLRGVRDLHLLEHAGRLTAVERLERVRRIRRILSLDRRSEHRNIDGVLKQPPDVVILGTRVGRILDHRRTTVAGRLRRQRIACIEIGLTSVGHAASVPRANDAFRFRPCQIVRKRRPSTNAHHDRRSRR